MNFIIIAFISLGLIFLAGLFNGVMDTLSFRYGRSIFPKNEDEFFLGKDERFWNPEISWLNKYKNWPDDKRPKFFLSTTALVMFTDGWHLIKFGMKTCLHSAIVLPVFLGLDWSLWWVLPVAIFLNLFFGFAFNIMYSFVLLKKINK